jgi:hypothetical protein
VGLIDATALCDNNGAIRGIDLARDEERRRARGNSRYQQHSAVHGSSLFGGHENFAA